MNAIAQGVYTLAGNSQSASTFWAIGLFAIGTGLFVMAGFLTPFACAVATLGYLTNGFALLLSASADKHVSGFAAFDLAAMSLALVLLGPGAYSVDARIFGRREIIIPAAWRPPQ